MKARRVVFDGLIVVAALGLLASPYLLPEPKIRPYIQRSKLVTSAPVFGWQTDADGAYATVTLTISNAGPTDLECEIDWFDARTRDILASPELYSGVPRGSMMLRSGAASNLTVVAWCSSNTLGDRVCCYGIHWQQRASWLARTVARYPALEGVLRRGDGVLWDFDSAPWNRRGEEGWAFKSNIGVGEYFRLVHGLDHTRWLAEEEVERQVRTAASEEYYRIVHDWWDGKRSRTEGRPEAEAEARQAAQEKARETALAIGKDASTALQSLWGPRTPRQEARGAFMRWFDKAGGEDAEPGAAPNDGPATPQDNSDGLEGGRHR